MKVSKSNTKSHPWRRLRAWLTPRPARGFYYLNEAEMVRLRRSVERFRPFML